MVVSGLSSSDIPTLRGNPFDSRPIERNRASEIVGREDILIRWKEHMHSQSPRLILLSGERGSGRTSLINAISSQTNERFVGTYWHSEDPLNCALDELAVTFCGYEVPPTMHQKVERVVETLDSSTGPLPLVALDYPSHVDVSSFLPLIIPILQRFRALVIVSLSNAQLASLDENLKEVFDETASVEPFTQEQVQLLSDLRIRKMSPEKWHIRGELLESIVSRTGGNARSVVSILRDLVDERRNMGSAGTLESLSSWKVSEKETFHEDSEKESSEYLDSISSKPLVVEVEEERAASLFGYEIEDGESDEEYEEIENDDWDVEPEDMWSEEEMDEKEATRQREEEIELTSTVAEDSGKITDWTVEDGTALSMDEGTEPPNSEPSRGFSGLVSRSRITNVQMPTGPDSSGTPIQEPEEAEPPSQAAKTPQVREVRSTDEPKRSLRTDIAPIEEKKVFFSEGELWTVDSESEVTLPETSDESEFEPEENFIEKETETNSLEEKPAVEKNPPVFIQGPRWESEEMVDSTHLARMSDAERLIVSMASSREISPSDAEIQARLEVGRPRLSQIYNSLHKSGILAVRKEGRSRLFKISDAAGDLLRKS